MDKLDVVNTVEYRDSKILEEGERGEGMFLFYLVSHKYSEHILGKRLLGGDLLCTIQWQLTEHSNEDFMFEEASKFYIKDLKMFGVGGRQGVGDWLGLEQSDYPKWLDSQVKRMIDPYSVIWWEA